ncbi:hypothetical protein C8J56DRAFT_1066719 [Mycena floridula]|nr:hypothetical protein C8J56DRAFT_1066719 [Mycena floridula]
MDDFSSSDYPLADALWWSVRCEKPHRVRVPSFRKSNGFRPSLEDFRTHLFMPSPGIRFGYRHEDYIILQRVSSDGVGTGRRYVLWYQKSAAVSHSWDATENTIFQADCLPFVQAVFGNFVLMVVNEWDCPLELKDNDICHFRSLIYQECSMGRFTAFPIVFQRPKTWGKAGGQSLWLTLPPELTDYIVESLSPDDRFWLATVSKFFAQVVKRRWMCRLRTVLALFFSEHTTKLLSELSDTSSFLAGSVLFNVLLDGPQPDNLNFISPNVNGQRFLVALRELSGFSDNKRESGILEGAEGLLESFTVLEKGSRRLTLSVSANHHCLPVVVSAAATAQMNFIAGEGFFCLYPEHFRHRKSLYVGGPLDHYLPESENVSWVHETAGEHGVRLDRAKRTLSGRLSKHGIQTLFGFSGWGGPCGQRCPRKDRDIRDLEGISVMRFSFEESALAAPTWSLSTFFRELPVQCTRIDCLRNEWSH